MQNKRRISINKFALRLSLPLALFITCACSSSDDDSVIDPSLKGNKNRNATFAEVTNLASASEAAKISQRMEMPALKGGENWFMVYKSPEIGVNFCVEWDTQKRSQRWTAYQMTTTTNTKNWNRNNWPDGDPFQPDYDLPAEYRTELSDYRGSGYNRGHICPSADRLSSKTANGQTFYLTNIQPMVYNLNGYTWEYMEDKVRKWSPSSPSDTMYVCKGGTIDNGQYKTHRGLLVPNYFFMAILVKNNKSGNGGYKAMAFWIEHKDENQGGDLKKFAISIDELEAKTGIDFFCNLPDNIEEEVESKYIPSVWGLE